MIALGMALALFAGTVILVPASAALRAWAIREIEKCERRLAALRGQ